MAVSSTHTGAFSGAGQGAAAGAPFGPAGAAVGAVLGGVMGGFAGQAQKRAQRATERAIRLSYGEQLRQLQKEGQLVEGMQTARYAASGVRVGTGSARTILEETRSEYARRQMYTAAAYRNEMRGAQAQARAGQLGDMASGVMGAAGVAATAFRNNWFDPTIAGGSGSTYLGGGKGIDPMGNI